LRDLRGGAADTDASTALAELVQAVRETGRSGSVVIELKLKPVTANDGSQLIVEDVIKVKKPVPQRGNTVLFTTAENDLSRRDPRQPEFPSLREVTNVSEFKKGEAAQV
jgi:hypothetical protein